MRHWLAWSLLAAGSVHAATADFNGVWRIASPVTELRAADGSAPPLLPAAQALYDQRRSQHAAGKLDYDRSQRCKPMGEPRTAYDPEAGPFEILVSPSAVVFGYTWNRMVRFVYVTPKAPDPIGPTYYGTATATWQKGSLLLQARDFHDDTLLDAAGMPHSDALSLAERFQLSQNGQQLVETLRITDPKTFSRPWNARLLYQRQPGAHIAEDVCIERRGISDY